jgi:threonine aldolase
MAIDLRSDTVTRPSREMRAAIAEAEVGDDVLDGDPTTKRLETRVAEILGKEKALFFPTGTMANQAAIWLQSERGTEVFADGSSHLFDLELGASAVFSGVQLRPVWGDGPMMDASSLDRAFRWPPASTLRPSLVCLENTHNSAGGLVIPLAGMQAMAAVARARGCRVHLDGARLWNAAVASGTPLAAFAACADTVMVSFSKGLGAPAGAALAGPADLIARAIEVRRRFGGGMRQSGVLAAAALYGLQHNYDRLSRDHDNATTLAMLADHAIAATVVPPDSNIVMIDLAPNLDPLDVAQRTREEGVLVAPWSQSRIRVVLHLDVSETDAEHAGDVIRRALDDSWRDLADTSDWPAATSSVE